MKKISIWALFLIITMSLASSVSASTLKFNPDSLSSSVNQTFTVSVNIDAGTDQVAGSDVYVVYDPAMVEAQTVTAGSYFPKVSNVPNSGRLYISGIIENQGEYKTGQGTIATIVFKSLAAGNSTLKFDCDLAKSDTSKIVQNDINATNIINCDGNGSLITSITSGTGTTTSTNPTQTILLQSGAFDSMGWYTAAGTLLVLVGTAVRFFL